MSFIKKTQAEIDAMTPEDAQKYFEAKEANEKAELQKKLDELTVTLKEQFNGDMVKVNKAIEETMESLNQLKEMQNSFTNVSYSEQLKSALTEKHEEIKNILKAKTGLVEIELKAVGNVTTSSGTNTSPPAITGAQQAPIQNINLREIPVLGLTTNLNTSLAAYPYTEAKPKEGDYTFLSEGGTKQQIDFTWETNYAKPVKAAAWERLTEEVVYDIVGLQSVAEDLLFKKHNLKKAKGILFGDGSAPNPKGATVYARAFSAGDMANAVKAVTFMDVVNACITDIATTHNYTDEMPYMANIVMVNPVDFFIELVSAKSELTLQPLYPTASLFNMVNIGGVTIIPEESIPAGKIFVADMTKYNTTNYLPYTVKVGWVNDDFIKNQFVILGESRFHAFVKKLDEQAFIYDDIATIKDAITYVAP